MRWVVRLVLMVGLLLVPLWICARASDAGAAAAGSAMDAARSAGAADPGSSSPNVGPEDGAGAIEDDDGASSEVLPAGGSPRIHGEDGRSARVVLHPIASPPHVHLEAETPPPRP